jgi:hypothetical protein
LQLFYGNIFADRDIAAKMDIVIQRCRFKAPCHIFDGLVVRGDTKADKSIWYGQSINDVDCHIIAKCLDRRFGCIIASRPGANNRNVPHDSLLNILL